MAVPTSLGCDEGAKWKSRSAVSRVSVSGTGAAAVGLAPFPQAETIPVASVRIMRVGEKSFFACLQVLP